jgi:SAM-dependent methyltransferase
MTVSYPEDDNAVCYQVEDGSPWFRHRNDCIAAVVKRFPPAGAIVDVGGGNGYVARRLIDEGFETIVVEPGPAGAENARTGRGIATVICATLEDAGFRESSLAAVGLFDVLEHIEDDRAMVARLSALLQPGGLAYVTVPSPPWLYSMKDVDALHFRRYSIRGLTEVFGAAFQIAYVTYLFSALTLPTLLLRALPYRLGFARPRTSESYAAEHNRGARSAGGLMASLLARELAAIRNGRVRVYGTSCLLVARKR